MATTTMTTDTAIHVRGLTKRYGSHTVLDGVNLDIRRGETYALLGPNGAGKSTTIEILEGLRTRSGGDVHVLGQDPHTAPRTWRNCVGIVSQDSGDIGPHTPRELINFFRALYPNPRATDEVLELVGLTEKANSRAAKMSGGQKRRLDVALGIVGRPELIFLDEPTTGFDPEARRQFWSMLEGLSGEGVTILLTTHYLDEAAHLADRVGVLTRGTIVAEAPPEELGGDAAGAPVVEWTDRNGTRHEHTTDEPAAFVARLHAEGGEPVRLEVKRPTLEDIYLGLIEGEHE